MNKGFLTFLFLFSTVPLLGCQTTVTPNSGYLSNYAVEGNSSKNNRNTSALITKWRNDNASNQVRRVYIQPAIIVSGVGSELNSGEKLAVLNEVDKQICFEISKRFELSFNEKNADATIRTAVARIDYTGRISSGASAVGKYFIPVPVLEVRVPGALGGIAIESEMIDLNKGEQIAFITWGRNAKVIGTDAPSLSKIGDALQLAEPMADEIVKAFAAKSRGKRTIENPDPCKQFGPRIKLTAGNILGVATGLYIPEGRKYEKEPEN